MSNKLKQKENKEYIQMIRNENEKEVEQIVLEQNLLTLCNGTKLEVIEKSKAILRDFKINDLRSAIMSKTGKGEQKKWAVFAQFSDLTHVDINTDISSSLKSKKQDSEKSAFAFTLYHKNRTTYYDLVAQTRSEFTLWIDTLRMLLGEKMKEKESLTNISNIEEMLLELSLIEKKKQVPPTPPPPFNYNFHN
ncbi:engulfment and cell motility protein [Anaeramoeba flamelloides]|uniref:Engulfment and cell motility protein n=1 Tax=Anaeramoeba flamelloides TaxID=1746091 RepID=A0AAV7ZIC5_9EUKA|nr:engulfment and cell motility protein [Anaeramoeba flamelloides]